ncbi:hypothetical protein WJX81_008135 [Elliptochloris bilobata]|uniref:Thioredoxin domain-containing protein n=1 Tax=Elliptochloris bilobata TaxID=381761 RepID=A0AAW1R307_9CHLO
MIASEEDLQNALAVKDVVVVDWMASWCRKCIYLKPKLEKMFHEEFADVPLVFVDVNKVPGSVVYSNGIRKMPTIVVYRGGKKVAEHIAAEGGLHALEKVREMMKLTLMD